MAKSFFPFLSFCLLIACVDSEFWDFTFCGCGKSKRHSAHWNKRDATKIVFRTDEVGCIQSSKSSELVGLEAVNQSTSFSINLYLRCCAMYYIRILSVISISLPIIQSIIYLYIYNIHINISESIFCLQYALELWLAYDSLKAKSVQLREREN